MPDTAKNVTDLVRTMLNDRNANIFTDQFLFPLLESSRRTLQRDLALANVRVQIGFAEILVPIGQTLIDSSGLANPQLPADLIQPWALWEKENGNGGDRFAPMAPAFNDLPDRDPQGQLLEWRWDANKITTLGATTNRLVRIEYERRLAAMAPTYTGAGAFNAIPPLEMLDAIDCLAARTAGMAARSRGQKTLADDYVGQYEVEKQKLIASANRPTQRQPAKRRPYGARRRALNF
jgi:hypothetical protein